MRPFFRPRGRRGRTRFRSTIRSTNRYPARMFSVLQISHYCHQGKPRMLNRTILAATLAGLFTAAAQAADYQACADAASAPALQGSLCATASVPNRLFSNPVNGFSSTIGTCL